jgi:hypothetical protein
VEVNVCHHLNVGAKAKLAKELHLLIIIKSTLAQPFNFLKWDRSSLTNIINFKTNMLRTFDILPTPRKLKIENKKLMPCIIKSS